MIGNLGGALLGLLGASLGALLGGWQQRANTRTLIASEFQKLSHKSSLDTISRIRARKEEWLLQAIPDLVAAADPELHSEFDYMQMVRLIHKIQVILDPRNPLEAGINQASSNIGFAVQSVRSGSSRRHSLLKPQSDLIEAMRAFLASSS